MERAKSKLHAARVRNKGRFNRTHRLRPKKIEEGDWVLQPAQGDAEVCKEVVRSGADGDGDGDSESDG